MFRKLDAEAIEDRWGHVDEADLFLIDDLSIAEEHTGDQGDVHAVISTPSL